MATVQEPGRPGGQGEGPDDYQEIYTSPEFDELRKAFRRLVLPLAVGFMAWYLIYVLTATYARDFMAEELVGRINVGLVFGLLQFVSTFGIAYLYAKRAEREIDPLSGRLLERFNNRGGAK